MIDRLISIPRLNQPLLFHKWEKFVNGEPINEDSVFVETMRGWQRSKEYGIAPHKLSFNILSESELAGRRARIQELFTLYEPHLETIKKTVCTHSSSYYILLADHEGYVLHVDSDQDSAQKMHFIPGTCFAERFVGNNAIGSVLATGVPLTVIGAEHYVQALQQWTSVGAPILDGQGNMLAVIQVSVPCGMEGPYTFSITVAAAKAVEARYIQRQMASQLQEISNNLSQLIQQREIIFNAMSQGVLIINKDCVVTFFNKAAEKIWDAPASEAVGKKFHCLRSPKCSRDESFLVRTIREERPFTNLECNCTNGHHDINLLVNTSLFRDENNAVAGAIGIYTDVTLMRRQEARIREQEKLAVIGQMAAGVAHEIRNPLTSVRGFAQLIRERMDCKNSSLKEYMEIMIQEIDQADSFINNFLQLARPKPPQMQQCSLNDLVIQFIRIFESQAFLRGVKIITKLQELPLIVIDIGQIKQVLLNLCQNALQASTVSGTITIVTEYLYKDKEACLRVIDDGPGISQEDLDKLGTPFYTTKDTGTGLGLSISYAIIDRHHGRMEVKSRLGEGTSFCIYLPVDIQF
ncbi:ATP-binding protein [Desulforamulus aeronauticus]|uniref:histidine kinase n=1 Tax=Desulforamulus aeronauticus DSM 10349 TaxID=1121421 RepID=A0A1M6SUB6_9FIRM|nr:ATP-binding protein [Desulforamulus aeronauticus]SHK48303.1 PAS domain-containing protein [Desulforamulus aeronauticus DSM 10349]